MPKCIITFLMVLISSVHLFANEWTDERYSTSHSYYRDHGDKEWIETDERPVVYTFYNRNRLTFLFEDATVMNLFITTDIEWSHKEHEPVIYTYDASDIEGNKYSVKVVDGTEDGCTLFFISRGNTEYYFDTQEWSMCH